MHTYKHASMPTLCRTSLCRKKGKSMDDHTPHAIQMRKKGLPTQLRTISAFEASSGLITNYTTTLSGSYPDAFLLPTICKSRLQKCKLKQIGLMQAKQRDQKLKFAWQDLLKHAKQELSCLQMELHAACWQTGLPHELHEDLGAKPHQCLVCDLDARICNSFHTCTNPCFSNDNKQQEASQSRRPVERKCWIIQM